MFGDVGFAPVYGVIWKNWLAYTVVPVVADKKVFPDAVKLLTDGDATRLIVGLFTVPPVAMFVPWPTVCTPEPVCAKIEYKFVLPERIVPPDNVVAENEFALRVSKVFLVADYILPAPTAGLWDV